RLQYVLGHARDLSLHARGGAAQRQLRGPAFLSGPRAAHRARLHPGERGNRSNRFPRAGRAFFGSSPAGVRFPHARPAALGRGVKDTETSTSAWKMERDSEGIVWLTVDKPG